MNMLIQMVFHLTGPIGVAAAAAVLSCRKRKHPHHFETNPSRRKRQQTRLLRWVLCLGSYAPRLGIYGKKNAYFFYFFYPCFLWLHKMSAIWFLIERSHREFARIFRTHRTLKCSTSGWILKTTPPGRESKIGECHATDYAFLRLWHKFEVRKFSLFVRFTFRIK